MKTRRFLLLALALLTAACTSFHELRPLAPAVGNPNFPTEVDTLQPILRWEGAQAPEPGTTYDLIVYEGIRIEDAWEGVKRSVGREVYYREGLPGTEHALEEPLRPGTEYYWSVRTRQGGKVSAWATYDYTLFLGTAYMHAGNRYFIFKTAKE